jgi:hypothetical protein
LYPHPHALYLHPHTLYLHPHALYLHPLTYSSSNTYIPLHPSTQSQYTYTPSVTSSDKENAYYLHPLIYISSKAAFHVYS